MKTFITLLYIVFSMTVFGQSVVGRWVTIDDKTGKKKSIVELYKKDSKLYGKITYLFPEKGREDNPKCTECTDYRKNKPLIGMRIVLSLNWNGSEWEGGTILDPENGKIYKVSMWINPENDNALNVRGYIGIFYRTQNWYRIKDKN